MKPVELMSPGIHRKQNKYFQWLHCKKKNIHFIDSKIWKPQAKSVTSRLTLDIQQVNRRPDLAEEYHSALKHLQSPTQILHICATSDAHPAKTFFLFLLSLCSCNPPHTHAPSVPNTYLFRKNFLPLFSEAFPSSFVWGFLLLIFTDSKHKADRMGGVSTNILHFYKQRPGWKCSSVEWTNYRFIMLLHYLLIFK